MSDSISLAEFIHQVKEDLLKEQFVGGGQVPLVAIQEIEVEVSVVASREAGGGAKAGLKLSVPGLGEAGGELAGEGKLGRANTQMVRVKLNPLLNTEQLLAQMSPEELKKVQEQAKKYLARSAAGEARGADRA
jgi:hypothetical protein